MLYCPPLATQPNLSSVGSVAPGPSCVHVQLHGPGPSCVHVHLYGSGPSCTHVHLHGSGLSCAHVYLCSPGPSCAHVHLHGPESFCGHVHLHSPSQLATSAGLRSAEAFCPQDYDLSSVPSSPQLPSLQPSLNFFMAMAPSIPPQSLSPSGGSPHLSWTQVRATFNLCVHPWIPCCEPFVRPIPLP